MDQMTSKERIINAIEGRAVDRLPFAPFLAYVWESFPADIQAMGQLAFLREIGADPLWRGAPCPIGVSVPGVEVKNTQDGRRTHTQIITPVGTLSQTVLMTAEAGQTPFLCEHPLKIEEDYKIQLWIEEHTQLSYNPAPVEQYLKEGDGREGLSLGMLSFHGKTAFQSLIEHFAGTQELTQHLLLEFPETVETLYEAMRENHLKGARLAAEAPYEYFLTYEDSSTQNYSPAMYERYIAPEIKGYCEILAEAGKGYIQHACGYVRHLIPMMKACGVRAVESMSPLPTGNLTLAEARALAGAELGIIGGIEPLAFLNTPMERFREYVERVIADGHGGPFVLANSDSCPPGVTVEKFRIAAEVARNIRF